MRNVDNAKLFFDYDKRKFCLVPTGTFLPLHTMTKEHLTHEEKTKLWNRRYEESMEDVLEEEWYRNPKVEECSGKIVDGQGNMVLRIL